MRSLDFLGFSKSLKISSSGRPAQFLREHPEGKELSTIALYVKIDTEGKNRDGCTVMGVGITHSDFGGSMSTLGSKMHYMFG